MVELLLKAHADPNKLLVGRLTVLDLLDNGEFIGGLNATINSDPAAVPEIAGWLYEYGCQDLDLVVRPDSIIVVVLIMVHSFHGSPTSIKCEAPPDGSIFGQWPPRLTSSDVEG